MEKDQQASTESKTSLVEQIKKCLHSGDYSRALNLLRAAVAEFPDDTELSELEKLAHNGVQRNAEANGLITQSQELFAQQKPTEAIQVLRQAYELDKSNSLARAILANALVEHAQSIIATDWLEAETLTNQAIELNPVHPMAKTIRGLIVEQKKVSPVEDWISRARKLQSAGDLFVALAWVAEGLAVHPDDPRLIQVQDAIQSEQGARQRQARRRDLEDLRRMEHEIAGAADAAAKQALAARIQAVTAKYWTDGEILYVANSLLHRLGLVPHSIPSPNSKAASVILHVPRPNAAKPAGADKTQAPTSKVPVSPVPRASVPTGTGSASKIPPRIVPPRKVPTSAPRPQLSSAQAATVISGAPSTPVAKATSPSSQPKQTQRSESTTLILFSCAAIILVTATFFLTRKHYAAPTAKTESAAPTVSAPAPSEPIVSAPATAVPLPAPAARSLPVLTPSSETAVRKIAPDHRSADSAPNVGTLLVVSGEDGANVSLNGQLQQPVTQAGHLRLPNLEPKDYVVQVSKNGYQDPPAQTIRIRRGEQAKLVFNLQPQPRPALLAIRDGAPGTAVLVDQNLVGTVQPDGNLSISGVDPGDHTVELRKEGFKPRQFKKHFMPGVAVSLAAADARLEAAPGELKITFAPVNAKVAIVKGEFLRTVSSGVPISLAAGTYTLSARTSDSFTRWSTLNVIAGQSKTLDLSLAPGGMSRWDDPGAWKQDGDSFIRKGGDFVLYRAAPAAGTFAFSAMISKGRLLRWVLNYTDPNNYVLFQMDNDNFYRVVIRNGKKTDEIKVPDKGDKKSFRTLHVRVGPTEIVHMIKHGDSWTILDRWTQPGADLSAGKFGFYIPGDDQVALSSFAHYADLNVR